MSSFITDFLPFIAQELKKKKDDVLSFFVHQTKLQSDYLSHRPSNVCWQ